MKLAPNPARNQVTVILSKRPVKSINVSILDIMGRNVAAYQLNEKSAIIPLSGMDAGIYLVRINGGFGEVVRKLVIEQ